MKRTAFTKVAGSLLIIAILASGCASTTVLHTTPADADVYVQSQRLGKTPYTYSDRKIIGASTLVTFKKDGYEAYNTTIRKNKKLNVGALISGLLFIYPLFWVMGYDKAYSYDLDEIDISIQPVAQSEPAEPVVTSKHAEAYNPGELERLPQSARVEKLLAQGEVEKAVEYAEDQEGAFQAGCFFAIAQYYLDKGDYASAENFFNRSGKTNEGNVRIAEDLMRGEIIDSVMVIDEKKIKTYLEKVYDSNEEITGIMAACYEKYADESKERISLAKKLKDMGMISMSSGGKTVNIDRSLAISRVHAIFYLNSAINAYEEINNFEKVRELKEETKVLLQEFQGEISTEQVTATDSTAKVLPAISDDKKVMPEIPEMSLTAEDDRVFIAVDSIVRTATQPQDLVTAFKDAKASLASSPARNADYVLVYFNRTIKKDLNLTSYKQYLSNISIGDQLGKNYAIILERGPAYIRTSGGGQLIWNPKGQQTEGVIINCSY
ncbi:MAG: PEGA domain-containing protein, partial [Bacteroidales bacterium]|nr:PEGA domain-containing protein [Bacteroidales bacterium]